MAFYLKHYRPLFNEWDEERLAQVQKKWDEWASNNQQTLLDDLEEDCAPAKRYHYEIQPTSISDDFYICFGGERHYVASNL